MKKAWLILWVLLACTQPLWAEERMFEPEIKVVLQVSDNDPELFKRVLTNTVNLIKAYGMDEVGIEIVTYAGGIWMMTEKGGVADRIKGLQLQYVKFSVCGFTLSSIEASQHQRPKLLEDVEVVPYGLARIVELQRQGYAYIRP
ncbi:MAG: DsrE family protein [bacterium]|nr:DsrE family protein [bacterium]